MADIKDVATYTVFRLLQNGNTICHLKLQKILYYLQAWYLVYFDHNLLFEDAPEAWVNGPVYRVIYDIYKDQGMFTQFSMGTVIPHGEDEKNFIERLLSAMDLSDDDLDFTEAIYKHYGAMSHDYLVFLTHSQQPWNEARKGLQPFEYTNEKISFDVMYNYYSDALKK